jgi:flagellar basal body-associated protein FliL
MEEKEEQISAIILDEIDDNEEQLSGNELDVPEEIEEQSATYELGEAEEDDELFSGNELDENDEGFSGNELDEPENVLNEPQDETSKLIPYHEHIKIAAKIFKGKRRLGLVIAFGLVFLSGIGYLFIKDKMSPVTSNQNNESKQVAKFAIPNDQVLVFDSFVIPFIQSNKFSYISLTIAFKLQNNELKREMIQEKYRLRGIIYDMLSKEINALNDVPSLEKLKNCIIRTVNGALSIGKINDAYITDLIAV